MMAGKKIVVVTDSSAYIPPEARAGLDIAVIPLWLLWEGKGYQDGVDMFPEEFYRRLKAAGTLPTSSQPSAQEFADFYQKLGEDADGIVSVLVSSKISGTIASAEAAAAEHPELDVRIVNSYSSAMGLGLTVLAAARAAGQGRLCRRSSGGRAGYARARAYLVRCRHTRISAQRRAYQWRQTSARISPEHQAHSCILKRDRSGR